MQLKQYRLTTIAGSAVLQRAHTLSNTTSFKTIFARKNQLLKAEDTTASIVFIYFVNQNRHRLVIIQKRRLKLLASQTVLLAITIRGIMLFRVLS